VSFDTCTRKHEQDEGGVYVKSQEKTPNLHEQTALKNTITLSDFAFFITLACNSGSRLAMLIEACWGKIAHASGVETTRERPVTARVAGRLIQGILAINPLASSAAITRGVSPIEGIAMRIREGITCEEWVKR